MRVFSTLRHVETNDLTLRRFGLLLLARGKWQFDARHKLVKNSAIPNGIFGVYERG